MTPGVKPMVAGNWKMNGLAAAEAQFRLMLAGAADLAGTVDLVVCPPATLLARFAGIDGAGAITLGGQDCHAEAAGAHTGDIAPEMLKDAGAGAAIVGHSERRADHGETDAMVRAKAAGARRAGLTAIVCVGETAAERDAGRALDIVGAQLAGSLPDDAAPGDVVVAYEPVWAIGTGVTPTAEDVSAVHAFIRARLVERFAAAGGRMRILYGGSVKPANAAELLAVANVDGALVGGASLAAADFLAIARAAGR